MTLPPRCFDLKLWSVSRPPGSVYRLLQDSQILWEFAKRCERDWALREGSHGPPCTPAPAAACIQCFAQSSRLTVSAEAYPFCGIHGFRIVTCGLLANCR